MTLFNKFYWFIITHEDVSTGIILIASIALVLCIKWLMKSIAEYRQDELAGTKLVKIKKVEILFIKVISQLIICSILWNLSELYAWKIFVTVLSALTFNALFIAVYELKELFKKM